MIYTEVVYPGFKQEQSEILLITPSDRFAAFRVCTDKVTSEAEIPQILHYHVTSFSILASGEISHVISPLAYPWHGEALSARAFSDQQLRE